jgi:hypothetical protein
MKIDKNKLAALAALSDEELWKTIRSIGEKNGFSLPEKAPGSSELQKLRSAMTDADRMNTVAALKLLNKYRKE